LAIADYKIQKHVIENQPSEVTKKISHPCKQR